MVGTSETRGIQLNTQLANGAIAGFVYFIAALVLMHLVRPDYTPIDHMISDYAVGSGGWIMTTAFVALAAGCLTLAMAMLRVGPASWSARAGTALLMVAGVGLVVTAIFPTDLETAPTTPTGDIHTLSFRVNVASVML